MKNKLTDVNNHSSTQLERIGDEHCDAGKPRLESERRISEAMAKAFLSNISSKVFFSTRKTGIPMAELVAKARRCAKALNENRERTE